MNEENEILQDQSPFPIEEGLVDKENREDRRGLSSLFSDFIKLFEQDTSAESKIRLSIDFMRASLTNSGAPRFKDFWEGRRRCLPLFKEGISPKVRSELWGAYVELSGEAKKLKELLDEQSAFAVEQIELAILGLERDLHHYDLLLDQNQKVPLSFESLSLSGKADIYNAIHTELLLLGTLAARVNAMRKEVVKTEMRFRIKNKLLGRLSACGDQVFPKRKELIRKISNEFIQDVDQFILSHFDGEQLGSVPLYTLREEIKQLQSIAKILCLNTHAFTQTRLKLSNCWDKIRNWEKMRKKETFQRRQVFKENFDLVMEKVKQFAEKCTSEMTTEECNKESAEIFDFMRTVELGRDEVRILKDEVYKARQAPFLRAKEVELERQRKETEAETLRREKINASKEALNALLADVDRMDLEVLISKRQEMSDAFEAMHLAKPEKQMIDRLLKQLKDAIDEKKEKALLMLSDDDLKALSQLKTVLEERKKRRQELKAQLEHYRKSLGTSGFDFEKAMMYRDMIEDEKIALEKVNASIQEIEEKIDAIES